MDRCAGCEVADALGDHLGVFDQPCREVGQASLWVGEVAVLIESDLVAGGEDEAGVGVSLVQRCIVDHDVDGRVGQHGGVGRTGGGREDVDEGVVVALALGAGEGVTVGVVAVLGTASFEVSLEFGVDERFEDGDDLGSGEWVTSRSGEVEAAAHVVEPCSAVGDVALLLAVGAVLVGEADDRAEVNAELAEGQVLGHGQERVKDGIEDLVDPRVGVDAADLVGVVDRDVAVLERIGDARVGVDELGQCVIPTGRSGAGIAGGPDVGRDRAMATGLMGTAGRCGCEDSGPSGV